MRQRTSRALQRDPPDVADTVLEWSTAVATLTVSSSGAIVGANAGMIRLLDAAGESDLLGRSIADLLIDRQDRQPWRQALDTGHRKNVEIRLRRAGGEAVAVRGDIRRVRGGSGERRLRGLFFDISAERQSHQAMQRGARLEALASLTGGVAHDFNNLLTVLIGNLSLVAEELRDRPALFEKLKASRDAAKRGSDLIGQLLGFARSHEVQTTVIDVAKVIENLMPLLGRALGPRVTLHTHLRTKPCCIRANAVQLESVIVNLAVNARDAMESGGRVDIGLETIELGAGEAGRHELPAGTFVRITVADDGPGIEKEILGRVFEPFFSTKGERGGTGLGLSMVRAFAAQCQGNATIASRSGAGTTVTILLPPSSDDLEETNARTTPLSLLPTGNERILIFSGDEGLRSTVRQILETLGYSVHACSDADDLALLASAGSFDLVIADGPAEKSGSAKARHVFSVGAAVPEYKRIVLSSGAQPAQPSRQQRSRVLLKPFSLADLAQLVRAALDED